MQSLFLLLLAVASCNPQGPIPSGGGALVRPGMQIRPSMHIRPSHAHHHAGHDADHIHSHSHTQQVHEEKKDCPVGPLSNTYYFITSFHDGNLGAEVPYVEYATPGPETTTGAAVPLEPGASPPPTTEFTTTTAAPTTTGPLPDIRALHTFASGGDFQRWVFIKASYGNSGVLAYAIKNKGNGLVLTATETAADGNGTQLLLRPLTEDVSQLFFLVAASKYHYLILNIKTRKFITNSGRTALLTRDMTKRHTFLQEAIPKRRQLWKVRAVPCDPFPYQAYRLIHRLSDLPIGVANASEDNKASVSTLAHDSVETNAQVMFRQYGNESYYYVRFGHAKKVIEVSNASTFELTDVIQSEEGTTFPPHQLFHIDTTPKGACLLQARHSRRYLGIKSQPVWLPNIRVVQLHRTVTQGEHFKFKRVPAHPEQYIAYRIRNRYSQKDLTVYQESYNPGAPIAQKPWEIGKVHQFFYIKQVAKDKPFIYQLKSKHSGLYIFADNKNNNTPVHQQPLAWGAASPISQFILRDGKERYPNGAPKYFIIESTHKQPQVLQPIGGVKGSCVGITTDNPRPNDPAQQWEFIPDIDFDP